MALKIKQLDAKDYELAREFAIKGMHLDANITSEFHLKIYSKFFLYSELLKATQILAAYDDNKFVGLLLTAIKDKPKAMKSIKLKLATYYYGLLILLTIGKKVMPWVKACQQMLGAYKKDHNYDGELNFFAVDPNINGKGIGTQLVNELQNRESGKRIYLYTNTNCSYQFYEKRGFNLQQQTDIKPNESSEKDLMTCFLYDKKL